MNDEYYEYYEILKERENKMFNFFIGGRNVGKEYFFKYLRLVKEKKSTNENSKND